MTVRPEELAATLRARAACRIADAQARAHRLRESVTRELTAMLRDGTVQRAWLIGSLAWGPYRERSDVDLVVEGLPPHQHSRIWEVLTRALRAEVDLLRLEDLPADFRARVLEEGVELNGS